MSKIKDKKQRGYPMIICHRRNRKEEEKEEEKKTCLTELHEQIHEFPLTHHTPDLLIPTHSLK